jgi:hypothetical protein
VELTWAGIVFRHCVGQEVEGSGRGVNMGRHSVSALCLTGSGRKRSSSKHGQA